MNDSVFVSGRAVISRAHRTCCLLFTYSRWRAVWDLTLCSDGWRTPSQVVCICDYLRWHICLSWSYHCIQKNISVPQKMIVEALGKETNHLSQWRFWTFVFNTALSHICLDSIVQRLWDHPYMHIDICSSLILLWKIQFYTPGLLCIIFREPSFHKDVPGFIYP